MHDAEHHLIVMLCVHLNRKGHAMRTTINLDDDLIAEAQRLTGTKERTALVHQGLRALIERESARRLAVYNDSIHLTVAPAGE